MLQVGVLGFSQLVCGGLEVGVCVRELGSEIGVARLGELISDGLEVGVYVRELRNEDGVARLGEVIGVGSVVGVWTLIIQDKFRVETNFNKRMRPERLCWSFAHAREVGLAHNI